jgi:hypothetical protein
MVLDTVMVRTNDSGVVHAVIYTENDVTDGLEGTGLSLSEALHDLADAVELVEELCEVSC